MDWILANWLWILLGTAFVAMHMFMHGGHGGGDDGGRDRQKNPAGDKKAPSTGHQH